jgi:cell wall-associated NlpC family hydrolase
VRCAVEVAAVRAEPRDDAEQVTQMLEREQLQVGERRDGWARIETAYGYRGWLRVESLDDGEGELPAGGPDPIEAARAYLGAPYEWGGLTARGIDCSGLVHIAYRASARLVPRDSWQQEAIGESVPAGRERRGDLVTYGGAGRADHVAFWLDEGRILHATARDGLGVVEEDEPAALRVRRRRIVRL